MKISDFWFKKLGKMLADSDYDLNERYAPRLLDWGFIKLTKWGMRQGVFHMDYSFYQVTDKGKKAYREWKENEIKSGK